MDPERREGEAPEREAGEPERSEAEEERARREATDPREEEGWSQPESSAQKGVPDPGGK